MTELCQFQISKNQKIKKKYIGSSEALRKVSFTELRVSHAEAYVRELQKGRLQGGQVGNV